MMFFEQFREELDILLLGCSRRKKESPSLSPQAREGDVAAAFHDYTSLLAAPFFLNLKK